MLYQISFNQNWLSSFNELSTVLGFFFVNVAAFSKEIKQRLEMFSPSWKFLWKENNSSNLNAVNLKYVHHHTTQRKWKDKWVDIWNAHAHFINLPHEIKLSFFIQTEQEDLGSLAEALALHFQDDTYDNVFTTVLSINSPRSLFLQPHVLWLTYRIYMYTRATV